VPFLSEPSFKAEAARLRDAIARAGGVSKAADVLERLLETGQPVLAEGFESGPSRTTAGA
jgi:hypothetical protein